MDRKEFNYEISVESWDSTHIYAHSCGGKRSHVRGMMRQVICGVAVIEARHSVGWFPSGATICDIKTTYLYAAACRIKRNSNVMKPLLHQHNTGCDVGYQSEKGKKYRNFRCRFMFG